MGYTRHIFKGVSWVAGIRVATRVLSFVRTIIIARILTPESFGVFGIATLVLTFIEIFTETGVNIYLIQIKEGIDKYINTSWMISILRGVVISGLILLLAPFVSNFFHSPDSHVVILLIALVPLLRGFINPSIVKFQKELLFHKEFIYRTSIFAVESVVSIILILWTGSVLGLVWGMVVSVIFEIVLSFYLISPRPSFQFELPLFKKVIGYGKWITASTIFNYFYQHGDDIAVGRLLGTGQLGLYDMAYRISLIPLTDISDVIAKVTFPVYVQISEDRKRLRKAFLKTISAVLAITIPIGAILFIFPESIIRLLLGEQWLPAAQVLRVLAVFGVIRAVASFSTLMFLSIGKQKLVTLITFVGLFALGVTIVPFIVKWGIIGAAYAALCGTVISCLVSLYYVFKEFKTAT